jgi:hypothetical protein
VFFDKRSKFSRGTARAEPSPLASLCPEPSTEEAGECIRGMHIPVYRSSRDFLYGGGSADILLLPSDSFPAPFFWMAQGCPEMTSSSPRSCRGVDVDKEEA